MMTDKRIIKAFTESLGSYRYDNVDGEAPIHKNMVKKIPKDKKQLVGTLWNGMKVFRVDFTWVRDNIDVSAIGGLHPFEQDWMPNEIWIEKQINPLDEIYYAAHEIIEYNQMSGVNNKKYTKSHDISNSCENILRSIYKLASDNKE
jgi:hypothetical protein